MDKAKNDRLRAAGWKSGDAADFLELSAEEAAYVELKLALADYLRELRTRNAWTQAQVARRLGSSQSRVAKMEAADASVSRPPRQVAAGPGSLAQRGRSRDRTGSITSASS
jgi:predicted XRE-type DNA-binding protein